MYRSQTLIFAGIVFILLNCVFSFFHCQDNFCPGENQQDWVYEYTDNSGKKFIVENGYTVPAEEYKETK